MTRVVPRLGIAVAATLVWLFVGMIAGAAPAGATPGPPQAPEYWFDSWHVPSLWAGGARGQGITIAEIDSGVNASLPQLQGRVLPGKDFGQPGKGEVDRDRDVFGHGTAMASIMVARPGPFEITGLAPGAKILPLAVPLVGTTEASASAALPAAIRYAADHGAKIINMSLGGQRTQRGNGDEPCPQDEQAAIFHALQRGAIVVASIGNTGPTRNVVEEPAVCLGVVSVGAVDVTGHVASFSARQPYLTLVAPGVGIPSLGRVAGEAFSGRGTSQAAALVSAAMALVWSNYPALSGTEVTARILATLDAPRRHPNSAYGYGLLDAYAAVTADVPLAAPDPVAEQAKPFFDRYLALDAGRGLGPPPPRAGSSRVTRGRYEVGSVSRLSPRAWLGIGLAAVGVAALLCLAMIMARWRNATTAP